MHRRTFTRTLGAGAVALASSAGAAAPAPTKVKVGLITHAEGAHLSAYFPALAEAEEVESVALSDPSGETVAAARKALGSKLASTYTEPSAMLAAEKPAMALVSMEAKLSPPAIDAALDAGCHVMAEKPSCVRAEDFEPLVRKANRKSLHLMLALANRLNPEAREAKRLIGEGRIGKIYGTEIHLIADQTRLTRPSYHDTWRAKKARGGGGHLIWLGIHWLDLAMFMTGSHIREVAGFTGVVGGQPLDTEDSAALALKFDNGTFGTVTSGYYLDKGYHSHIKIWGSDGWLQIDKHGGEPLQWYSRKDAEPAIRTFQPPDVPTGYSPFVRACVRASAGLDAPPLTADDSLYVLKVIFAGYKAAETGRTQRVS